MLRSVGFGDKFISRVRGCALADQTGSAVRLSRELPAIPEPLIFFDVETGLPAREDLFSPPEPQEPWMIAAKLRGATAVHQWIVPGEEPGGRRQMFEQFLAFLRLHPDATLCSWTSSGFDARAVAAGLARWCPRLSLVWASFPQFSPLNEFKRAFVLPALDWKLDTLARFCGYQSPDEELDGFLVGMLYELYRHGGEPLPVDAIARYNAQDVRSLEHVVTWFAQHGRDLPQIAPVPQRRRSRQTPLSPERLRELSAAAPPGFRICPQCGECFVPRYRLQVYCVKSCGTRAREWRKTQRRAAASG